MSVQNIYECTPGAICGGGAGGTHTPLATCHLNQFWLQFLLMGCDLSVSLAPIPAHARHLLMRPTVVLDILATHVCELNPHIHICGLHMYACVLWLNQRETVTDAVQHPEGMFLHPCLLFSGIKSNIDDRQFCNLVHILLMLTNCAYIVSHWYIA